MNFRNLTGALLTSLVVLAILPGSSASEPLAVGLSSVSKSGSDLSYDRDVRPILSDKCYQCHGPDAETREADLRLDTAAGLQESGVVSGGPVDSELAIRILSNDPDLKMPPVASGLALSSAEKEILTQWLTAGAPVSAHWSFRELPSAVSVPAVAEPDWVRTPIDNFVLSQLTQRGVAPSPPAPPLTLLRRVFLDLTGVPPTLAEIEDFEADWAKSPDAAYESAVDRLLASPRFGEHLAVSWLDAARYADSYGFQSDQLNTQWPYRDWVIRAINDNLPYDQFLTWQLAGDLLPNATADQVLATAFCRMHRMTNEGGSLAEEWLNENACDRVNTFGSAILGLTLECARCHDHKYDPILQRDYYSIQAFFNSIDESGLYDNTDKTPSPSILLPTSDQERDEREARTAVAAAEADLRDARSAAEPRFEVWLADRSRHVPEADLVAHLPCDAQTDDDQPRQLVYAESPRFDGSNPPPVLPQIEGKLGEAIHFDGERRWESTSFEHFSASRARQFTLAFWLRDDAPSAAPVVVVQQTDGTDVGPNGFDVVLQNGLLEARLYRVWPGNAVGVRSTVALAPQEWTHVAVVYDGSSRAAGLRLYLNGEEVPVETLRDRVHKNNLTTRYGKPWLAWGGRWRDRGFRDGKLDEIHIYERALTPLELESLARLRSLEAEVAEAVDQNNRDALRPFYLTAVDPETRALDAALTAARERLVACEDVQQETAVMRELPSARAAFVLARGAYDAPKTDATRAPRDVFQQILPPFPAGAPRNRLGLAQWLALPQHPLTARVAVNRLWAGFFGEGLSSAPENLGSQGTPPLNVELLDWLARDFVDHGWDVKRFCRQTALSAVYRQSSAYRSDLAVEDPQNRL
ncbi:MAG: DUF1549 domain-containing protein, partial [Planctomycetales bacterium]|nr:DUF1549 domain-containing protein [Planctomycetales bacterium]